MQNRFGVMAKAFVISGLKGLAVSLAIALPGFLLMAVSVPIGVTWLFVGSFLQIAWSYRREWRVMWITTLLPPVAAGMVWAVQAALLRIEANPALVAGSVIVGLGLGVLRGLTHTFRVDARGVFARKTVWYLAFWIVCSLATQLLAHAGQTRFAGLALVTGAFSTAILFGISGVVLIRYLVRLDDLKRAHAGVAS